MVLRRCVVLRFGRGCVYVRRAFSARSGRLSEPRLICQMFEEMKSCYTSIAWKRLEDLSTIENIENLVTAEQAENHGE